MLDNRLKVLLVPDSKTDKSAVACDVYVGSVSDTGRLAGIGVFSQTMPFLGTKEYPTAMNIRHIHQSRSIILLICLVTKGGVFVRAVKGLRLG